MEWGFPRLPTEQPELLDRAMIRYRSYILPELYYKKQA
jgi:hypothetical protein